MPYFKNKNINILLIHIPKTGGTSLEHHFSSLYNIPLNHKSLYNIPSNYNSLYHAATMYIKQATTIQSSLQHMTYQEIVKYKKLFQIDLNHLQVIACVRNPYERIISDLFWWKLISIHSTKEEVFTIIQSYIVSTKYDNHNIPQYRFVTIQNKLIPNLQILRTETLTQDINKLGFTTFNVHVNTNKRNINYYTYLNRDSITLINKFYHLDFKLFKYPKLSATECISINTHVYPIVSM